MTKSQIQQAKREEKVLLRKNKWLNHRYSATSMRFTEACINRQATGNRVAEFRVVFNVCRRVSVLIVFIAGSTSFLRRHFKTKFFKSFRTSDDIQGVAKL